MKLEWVSKGRSLFSTDGRWEIRPAKSWAGVSGSELWYRPEDHTVNGFYGGEWYAKIGAANRMKKVLLRESAEEKIEFVESSGNIFADLGLPNPEERLAKAELARLKRCKEF